jgi:CHAT domain-containing protein/tetratricopeptide (TPR) repeat protein
MRTLSLWLLLCGASWAQSVLTRDAPLTVTLSGTQTAPFTISTSPSNYIRVTARSPESAVEIALLDARQSKLASIGSLGGTGGIAEVACIADGPTIHGTARLVHQDARTQRVQISLAIDRPATNTDRSDAAAFGALLRTSFQQAKDLAAGAGDASLQINASIAESLAHLRAGEFEQAFASAQSAMAITASDPRARATLTYVAAVSRLQHEEPRLAVPLFEQALATQRDVHQEYELSYSLHNLSVSHWLIGDCTQALDEAKQALSIRRNMRDRYREAYSLLAVAKDYFCLGDAQHALDTYAEVEPLWRELKDNGNRASVLNDRGLLYSYLGQWQQAELAHQDALALRTSLKDDSGLVESLINLGQLQVSLHHYGAAQQYCERALELARRIHFRRGEAYALLNLVEALAGLQEGARARPMLLDAIQLFREEEHRTGEAWGLELLAKLDLSAGNTSEARNNLERALVLERAIGDRILESITLVDLAGACRAAHQTAPALDYSKQAIDMIEQSRSSLMAPDLRAAWLASKRGIYELRIALLGNAAAETLSTSEQAHSRVLLDALAESGEHVSVLDPGLDSKTRSALAQADADVNARAASLARGGASQVETAVLRRSLDRALANKQEVESRIRETNPRYAALVFPQPASIEDIRRYALDEDTLLLEYLVGEERSHVWALTSHDLTMFELPGRAVLERSTRELYAALTERNRRTTQETMTGRAERVRTADLSITGALHSLAILLPPAVGREHRRVIVVPDGPLSMVPFALLLPARGDREVVTLPSASVLVEMRRDHSSEERATLPALVVADPVFGPDDERVAAHAVTTNNASGTSLPRLYWSSKEALGIAALAPHDQVKTLTGFAADSDILRHGDLSRYRVIHFATHALLDTEHPSLSAIVFSMVDRAGLARDGQVRLHEIYELSLQARLVVLSACKTGLGKEVSGEGMIGLSRGFLYAGAQSVLATLWSVDDYATAQFMSRFYAALWKEGRSPATALHLAQQWMMRQKGMQSPYYWAGYTLTGEWK